MSFNEDFGRIAQVAWNKERMDLQKTYSALYELFKPNQTQQGNSIHDMFFGKVEYQSSDVDEVLSDTPLLQHPSIRTKKNALSKSKILVAVPRKVAQVTGKSVEALASMYTKLVGAGMARRKELQLSEFLSKSYTVNTVMDGIDEQGTPTSVGFVVGNNRTPRDSANRMSYFDFLEARKLISDQMGTGLNDNPMSPPVRTVDDIKHIIYCDNTTWLAFVAQNKKIFFNGDYNQNVGQASVGNALKVSTFQDCAVLTTQPAIPRSDTFAGRFTNNIGLASGGTIPTNWATNYRPIYIFPRGAVEFQKPSADMFDLGLKELDQKSFEKALYGECNIYGKVVYEQLVYRYWVDVTNFTELT